MNASGTVTARRIESGIVVDLQWEAGRIKALKEIDAEHPESLPWLTPGLFDPQVNGYAGVDFQNENAGESEWLHAVKALCHDGCLRFLPTLITNDWNAMMRHWERIKELRERHPFLKRAIVGWHLEGPFLSEMEGYRGAHETRHMRDPSPKALDDILQRAQGDPVLVTLAPERSGAIEWIQSAVAKGIHISLGHTNASSEQIAAAVSAGATGFTHLGNGCPPALNRHDNILWRVLDNGGLTISLIPDGYHVSPSLFRLIHRLVPMNRIHYTADAMSAAGAGPGTFLLGSLTTQVGADGVVRLPGTDQFAGSSLRPVEGVFRAAAMLSESWRETWKRASTQVGEFLGLPMELRPGEPADFCLIEVDNSERLKHFRVCSGGELSGDRVAGTDYQLEVREFKS